jgi:hypothetical protein
MNKTFDLMECVSLRPFITDRSLKATKFIKKPQEKITKVHRSIKSKFDTTQLRE